MKAKAVSALWDKRELRSEMNRIAEPQVVGLAPQTTGMTERTDAMNTYLLRGPNAVEPHAPPCLVASNRFKMSKQQAKDHALCQI